MVNPFAQIDERLTHIETLLQQIATQQGAQPSTSIDEIGNITLAQEITGLKKATIYCHVHNNKIPHFKRGGKLYFSKQVLLEWITNESRGSPSSKILTTLNRPFSSKHIKNKIYYEIPSNT